MKFLDKLKNKFKKGDAEAHEEEGYEFDDQENQDELEDLEALEKTQEIQIQLEESSEVIIDDTLEEPREHDNIELNEHSDSSEEEFFIVDDEDFDPTSDGQTAEYALSELESRSEQELADPTELEDLPPDFEAPSEEDIDKGLEELMQSRPEEIQEYSPSTTENHEEVPSIDQVLSQAQEQENKNFHEDEEYDEFEDDLVLSSIDDEEVVIDIEDELEDEGEKANFFQTALASLKTLLSKSSQESDSKESSLTMLSNKIDLKSLTFDDIMKTLYSPELRPAIHKGFLVSSVVVASYVGGSLTSQFLEKQVTSNKKDSVPALSASQRVLWRQEVAVLDRTNPFNIKLNESNVPKGPKGPVKIDETLVCHNAKTKSALPLKLLNTIVLQDSVKSIASVQNRGKNLSLYEGDKINGMAEIGKIDSARVIFKNLRSGECEYIESKKSKERLKPIKVVSPKVGSKLIAETKNDSIKQTGNSFTIKKSYRDQMLKNVGTLLTQARAIPIKNPDGTLSFKMVEIVPGSPFSQLNVQNGDIITSINGKKYSNINELMALFGQLKNNDKYSISVKRDGVDQVFDYNFE